MSLCKRGLCLQRKGEAWMEVRRRSQSLCLPRFLHTLFFNLSAKETNCLMHKEQLVLLRSVFRGGFFLSGTQRWTWDVLLIVQDFLLSLQAWVSEGVGSFSRTRAACLPELGLSKGTEGVKLKFFFFLIKCFLLDSDLFPLSLSFCATLYLCFASVAAAVL